MSLVSSSAIEVSAVCNVKLHLVQKCVTLRSLDACGLYLRDHYSLWVVHIEIPLCASPHRRDGD